MNIDGQHDLRLWLNTPKNTKSPLYKKTEGKYWSLLSPLSKALHKSHIARKIADYLDVFSLRKLSESSADIHKNMDPLLREKMNYEPISGKHFKNICCIKDMIDLAKKLQLRSLNTTSHRPINRDLQNIAVQLSDLQELTIYAAPEKLSLPAGLQKLHLIEPDIKLYQHEPPQLKSLSIIGGFITPVVCNNYISKLTTLTSLKSYKLRIVGNDIFSLPLFKLPSLNSFPDLNTIDIVKGITLESLFVSGPTKLKVIRLDVSTFSDVAILRLLENSPDLTTLYLKYNTTIQSLDFTKFHLLSDISIGNFSDLSTLELPKTITNLSLAHCPNLPADKVGKMIKNLSKLKELSIIGQEDVTELNLQNLEQLQTLIIEYLPNLINLTPPPSHLFKLCFIGIPSANEVLPSLLKTAKYTNWMEILDCGITSFPDLKEFPFLKTLYMDGYWLEELSITEANRFLKYLAIRAPRKDLAAIDEIRSEKLPNLTDYVIF